MKDRVTGPRCWVYDEDGLLRTFWSEEEAKRFTLGSNEYTIKVFKKPKRERKPGIDWSTFEEAPF